MSYDAKSLRYSDKTMRFTSPETCHPPVTLDTLSKG